jgi:hypothetical protein
MKDARHAHPLWFRWNNMIARCYCKGSPSYKNYGARGITVDDRWRGYPDGFNAFVADMGMPPSAAMTLERVDNDGPYGPGKCIWADRRAQALNRRRTIWITVGDVTLCAKDWAHKLGVDQMTLRSRAKSLGGYEAAIHSYAAFPNGSLHLLTRPAKANHPVFPRWRDMINRCYCKSAGGYKNYGGQGITVAASASNAGS